MVVVTLFGCNYQAHRRRLSHSHRQTVHVNAYPPDSSPAHWHWLPVDTNRHCLDLQHQMLPSRRALIATRPVSNSCDVPCLMAFSTIGCRVNAGNCCWDNSCGIAMLTCNRDWKRAFQFADKRSHVQFRRRVTNSEGRFKFCGKVERYCTSWLACSLSRRITALMVLSALNKKMGIHGREAV